ncbi:ABC transporter permease [Bacillus sp. SD088]|uniref:ABC transporter permease n=1 Tax=Bacillus sp. SD088 TaxID=2782012 RepID=UPI001A970D15|nr:ABC transporter permease subunit [Bacillus sp. SD088]MBO0994388.1 ABC transporter permease subunit [Bacillus sp. SD088]
MFGLIQNEMMKIVNRKLTWIILFLLIVITIGSFVMNKINEAPVSDWQNEQLELIERYKGQLEIDGLSPQMYVDTENKLQIAEYRLENNIAPIKENPWSALLQFSGLIELVIIFAIVIAADVVSREYTSGTIKLLLIRPHSRSKILFSKYISVALFALGMLALLIMTGYGVNAIFYGFGNLNTSDLFLNADGKVTEINVPMQAIKMYSLSFLPILSYVTLSFAISTILRNSALAVGISLFIMIVGNSMIEATAYLSWLKYLPFANSDISLYIFHLPARPEMTLGFSLSVLLIYILVLAALSWIIFKKRDTA